MALDATLVPLEAQRDRLQRLTRKEIGMPAADVEHILLQFLLLAAAFYTIRAATHAWMHAKNAGIGRRRGGSLGD